MKPLSGQDARYFEAACGWLELGNELEAHQELDNITPELRAHPDVLELRCNIYATSEKWESCLTVSETLCQLTPERLYAWIYQARSLHHLQRDAKALELLQRITDRFPESGELFYLLGVVCCSMDDIKASRHWLNKAFLYGGHELRLLALDDEELVNVWKGLSPETLDMWRRSE